MKTVENYVAHAEECERLARSARTPEEKKMITEMAATWRMLAEQRRTKLGKAETETAGGPRASIDSGRDQP